jgi:hypothetical protein
MLFYPTNTDVIPPEVFHPRVLRIFIRNGGSGF